jgi:large subunit ribosomal protein L18
MSSYVPLLRRRREGVTDYRSRKRAVTSRSTLLVVRVSNKNVLAQFVAPRAGGDVVLSSSHAKDLKKLGWQGSLKSTPACYLLGLLSGKKALQKGVKDAVLYNGVEPFVRGGRVAAFVKGIVDAGINVPVGEDALPSADRLSGKAIAEYAKRLAGEDRGAYEKMFSALAAGGFKPEDYPAHFEKLKSSIMGGPKV